MTEAPVVDLYRLVESRYGRFLVNPKDIGIAESVHVNGEYAAPEYQLLHRLAGSFSIVIEAVRPRRRDPRYPCPC